MTIQEPVWLDICRKWRYPTRPDAMDRLVRVRSQRKNGERKERSVYRCARCGGYHLTHRLVEAQNDRAPELRGPAKRLVLT